MAGRFFLCQTHTINTSYDSMQDMFKFFGSALPRSSASSLRSSASAEGGRIYLDHGAATALSLRAREELMRVLPLYGNPSAIYKEGVVAKEILKSASEKIAKLLSCHPYELYFTGTGTESVSLAINGTIKYWHETHKSEGKLPHVITSVIEHPAVLETLRACEREGKVKVTYLPVTIDGLVKVSDVREMLTEETILVTLMYANNEIGTIQPVKEVGRALALYREEAKERRTDPHEVHYPYFHIDACQAGNFLPLDVKSLRADMMTLNGSKLYGPKGVALLFKREGVMVKEQVEGGGQERGLRSGTEAVPLIASFAEALVESQELKESEERRLLLLREKCVKDLQEAIPDIVLYGSFKNGERLPNNINCRIPRIVSEEVILRLDAKGFAISHKSACASESESGSHVILALGETELAASENLRITMGRSTTENDMTRFVAEMKEIASLYRNKTNNE